MYIIKNTLKNNYYSKHSENALQNEMKQNKTKQKTKRP
jgi:hypothetical protein